MAHDVFVSYASEDKPVADAICAALEARKIRCWIAPRDILPGQDYPTAIVRAINESRITIVVFSSRANSSPHIRSELQRAFDRELVIIPFRIENIEPSEGMQYYLSTPHWLDALTPPLEQHLEYLVETVSLLLTRPKKEPGAAQHGPEHPLPVSEAPSHPLPPSPEPSIAAGTLHPAGFGYRAVAYGIDLLLVFSLFFLLSIFLAIFLNMAFHLPMTTYQLEILIPWVGAATYLSYFLLTEVSPRTSSFGKCAVKIRIGDGKGEVLPWRGRLARWALKQFPFLLFFLLSTLAVPGYRYEWTNDIVKGLAVLWYGIIVLQLTVLSDRRQTWYDRYVGSLVTRQG